LIVLTAQRSISEGSHQHASRRKNLTARNISTSEMTKKENGQELLMRWLNVVQKRIFLG
jgi:hypothetical protein